MTLATVAYDDEKNVTRSFLVADYGVECYVTDQNGRVATPQHERLTTLAWPLIVLWPVGVPCLFLGLLHFVRRTQSKWAGDLSRSIGFLNREYRHDVWYCFYWEVVELVRKLWLTGFVFLVPQSLTLVRLLTSILVTVGHIVLLQRAQP